MGLQLERAIVGTIIFDPASALLSIKSLTAEDFSQPRYRLIFRTIKTLQDEGSVPDSNTVIDRLEKSKSLEKAGGRIEIMRMMEEAVSTSLLPQYVKDLREATLKNKLALLGEELKENKDKPLDEIKTKLAKLMSLMVSDVVEEPIRGSDTNFELRWKLGEHYVIAQVRRLKEHTEGKVTARLDIISTFPVGPKYLYQGIFNFLAPRSQSTLINTLVDRLPVIERKTWESLVIGMCHKVLQVLEEGNPTSLIKRELGDHRITWIINPLIPTSDPVVFFGKPGSGKSYLAQTIGLLLSLGDKQSIFQLDAAQKVLYLDWETSQTEISRRLSVLSKGMGVELPELYYRRCARSLEADVERIRSVILEKEITFLILDSLGPACGADLNAPEPAISFFNALRSLNLPAIITAHSPKNAEQASIYGSVFFEALARTIYEVVGYHDEGESLYVALYHRKSNLGKLQSPMAFRFQFQENSVLFFKEDIRRIPDAQPRRPLNKRIRELLLDSGPLTPKEIAEDLDCSANSVSVALSKMRNHGDVVRLPGHKWAVKTDDVVPF